MEQIIRLHSQTQENQKKKKKLKIFVKHILIAILKKQDKFYQVQKN